MTVRPQDAPLHRAADPTMSAVVQTSDGQPGTAFQLDEVDRLALGDDDVPSGCGPRA